MRRLVKVKLLGELGRIFGREYEFYIHNPADAIKALCANFGGFKEYLEKSSDSGIVYRVVIDDFALGIEESQFDYPIRQTLIIAPMIHKAKGFGKILLGVGLLAASFFMPASISLFGAAITSSAIGLLGASLVLGGIYQALSPVPKLPSAYSKGLGDRKGSDRRSESFLFDRASEIGSQGLPVPVGFGERLVVLDQSKVISSGISVNQIKVKEPDEFKSDDDDDDDPSALPIERPNNLLSRSYMELLFLIGEGEIEGVPSGDILKDLYLDDTPVKNKDGTRNLKGVTVRFRSGTPNQDYIPNVNTVENEDIVGLKLTRSLGSITRTINDSNTNRVRLRLMVPALKEAIEIKRNNTLTVEYRATTVEFRVDVQTDGKGFVELFRKKITGKTDSPYEREYEFKLPPGLKWDIRLTRITPDAKTSMMANDLYWQGYTKVVNRKYNYPYSALLFLRIDFQYFQGQPKVAVRLKLLKVGIPHNYDPNTRTYTGVFNGSFQATKRYTTNPAWIFYAMLTDPIYGLGDYIDKNLVDIYSLYEIARYCDELVPNGKGGLEPRFTCNIYFESREEALKVLESLASVFRGMIYYSGGSIFTVQNRPKETTKIYNESNVIQTVDENGNVTDPPFNYQGSGLKTRHSVALVTWYDPNDSFKANPAYVLDRESLRRYGYNELQTIAVGCTSLEQARRLGRWMLASERVLTQSVTFRIGSDGVLVTPGETFKIMDSLKSVSQRGGRIAAATLTSLTLDVDVTIEPGKIYSVSVYDSSAKTMSRVVTNAAGTTRTLTVSAPFSEMPILQTLWVLESNNLNATVWQCVSVGELENNTYEISGVEYNDSIWDYVDFGEEIEELPTSALPNLLEPPIAPSSLEATENLYATINSAGVKVRVTISFNESTSPMVESYEVEYCPPFDQQFYLLQNSKVNSATIDDALPGVYYFRVRAVNVFGKKSNYAVIKKEIFGLTLPPDNVTGFSINTTGSTAFLRWNASNNIDVQVGGSFRIKHTSNTTNYKWSQGIEIAKASGISTNIAVPLIDGTYMIKSVDSTGNQSVNFAAIVITNTKKLFAETQGFSIVPSASYINYLGNKVNTAVVDGRLQLATGDFFDAQPGLFDSYSGNFDEVSGYFDSITGLFDDAQGEFDYQAQAFGIVSEGTYTFSDFIFSSGNYIERDLYYPNSYRVSVKPELTAIGVNDRIYFDRMGGNFDEVAGLFDGDQIDGVDVSLEIGFSTDNVNYIWQKLISSEYIFKDYIKFRLRLLSGNENFNIYVSNLAIAIDFALTTISGDFVTSNSVATVFTYPKRFANTPTLSYFVEGLQPTELVELIASTATAFTIRVRDTISSNIVSRKIQYTAKGIQTVD